MAEKIMPGPVNGNACIREAVCVHTKKVYDSCKSKECIRDLRVYLCAQAQQYIDTHPGISVRPRSAELLFVDIDVEKVSFNRGFYTVNVRYFYRIEVEAVCPIGRPEILVGFSVFDKKVILFGSEGGARIFSSYYSENNPDIQKIQRRNRPEAVVEVLDPMLLDAMVVEPHYHCGCCCQLSEVPPCILQALGEDVSMATNCNRLFVTLGQFSIIRLERDIQLLMPAYDICLPERDCSNSCDGDTTDPCDAFEKFAFPIDEFFPPRLEPQGGHCGCCEPNHGNGCCKK